MSFYFENCRAMKENMAFAFSETCVFIQRVQVNSNPIASYRTETLPLYHIMRGGGYKMSKYASNLKFHIITHLINGC